MKHIKENILIYISLGLSTLVFIIPYLIDSDGFIEEIKTSPTSNIAWNILLFILMHIVLAFCIFVLIFFTYNAASKVRTSEVTSASSRSRAWPWAAAPAVPAGNVCIITAWLAASDSAFKALDAIELT